jgi:hypothetical protein
MQDGMRTHASAETKAAIGRHAMQLCCTPTYDGNMHNEQAGRGSDDRLKAAALLQLS